MPCRPAVPLLNPEEAHSLNPKPRNRSTIPPRGAVPSIQEGEPLRTR